ncbi:MAG: cyclic nucleotide-binding domain-containing protein [Deltaproteobacteria bacterium]|nr:cyclic nucleotide-binding domain-containing protein [Deltaproteobacteria bacterium]
MTTAAVMTARWPDAVWDAALLRGIDARARAEIEAAGRLRELRAGEHVYRPGEPADAVYVVVSGRFVLAAVRRGEEKTAVIRRAQQGDVFGEEATVVAFATRQAEARCEEAGRVAEVPLVVLRRAIGRAGGGEIATRLERALRRAATLDLLRTTSFTGALGERDIEILLDAAQHVNVARGDHVYREGDPPEHAYLVADGLLQAQSADGGHPRIEAYLSRGDLFGDDELEDRSRRRLGVVASGPAWLVAIPRDVFVVVARKEKDRLERVRRMKVDALPPVLPSGGMTTAHVFQDLYRMRVARSLLVIDQDSCIRCGHCAWSCSATHEDGISRLVRRGDKLLVTHEDARPAAPLLVPNSCQHCKNPSCMIDCPTGAIGRDARGEVFIREDLCTGCGSCAKACPWDNIQIAPRAESAKEKATYPDVAVKCDLCSGSSPACVAACPTQAIARIDPNAALAPLRAPNAKPAEAASPLAGAVLPERTAAWPWVLGAALTGVGVAAMPLGPWTSGVAAGALLVVLVGYSGAKRAPRVVSRISASGSLARALYVAHLALGALLAGVVIAHASHPLVPGDLGGALTLVMIAALFTGVFGGLVNTLVPRRLSRLERKSVLPEELGARARELDEQVFARLSGRSEVVKTLYGKLLRPYGAARFGFVWLALSGLGLREEEKRLRAKAAALLEGRKSEKLDGLDELIRLVVERRATTAVRLYTLLLRGWLGVHLAMVAASGVLVVLHVVAVMGKR